MKARAWENITTLPRPTPAELPGLQDRTLRTFHARRAAEGRYPAGTRTPVLELVSLIEARLNVAPGLSPITALEQVIEELLSTPDMRNKYPSGRYAAR